jgi:hypothetical protein
VRSDPVPLDTATEILELSSEGLGSNQIGFLTSVDSNTVKRVVNGKHKSYSERLSIRQVQALINVGFG